MGEGKLKYRSTVQACRSTVQVLAGMSFSRTNAPAMWSRTNAPAMWSGPSVFCMKDALESMTTALCQREYNSFPSVLDTKLEQWLAGDRANFAVGSARNIVAKSEKIYCNI
jgi:hypothetical protein